MDYYCASVFCITVVTGSWHISSCSAYIVHFSGSPFILKLVLFSRFNMLVAFQKTVLHPELHCIKNNWEYDHDHNQFDLRVIREKLQTKVPKRHTILVKEKYEEENKQLGD